MRDEGIDLMVEFNKTTDALYQSKTHMVRPESKHEPVDQRDVKVFSLDTKQTSRSERSTNKQERRDSHLVSEDKRCDSNQEVKEEEQELQQEKAFVADVATGMAFMEMAAQTASMSSVVEAAPVAVASADLQWIADTIFSTVESMMIASVDGNQLVEIVLDQNESVPAAFAGANLTLVQTGSDLSVKFSNFMNAEQSIKAFDLVSANPAQLAGLVEALKGKQLHLTEFVVGSTLVQLPTIEEVQSPLHMIAATIRNHDQEKDQEQKDQQQQSDQEKNAFYVEEARL